MTNSETSKANSDIAIVFVHGYMGYGEKRWLPDYFAFFRGVRSYLTDLGVPLYFPQMPRGNSVSVQAKSLADYVYKLPQKEIYIVGYSMGALHARYMIHHLDPEQRIKKLTTVAGAHKGTYVAEWVLNTSGIVQWIARQISLDSLLDLTREAGERFGKELKDRDSIEYRSYACVRPIKEIPFIFKPLARMLNRETGENDLLVPKDSAAWLNFQRVVRSDHLEVIGWNFKLPWPGHKRPFNHRKLFREIVEDMLREAS